MKSLLHWIKTNPLILASIVIALVAVLGLMGWVQGRGGAFVDRVMQLKNIHEQLGGMTKQTVMVPPEKPADPPRTISSITINRAAIDELKVVYGRMNDEYQQIFNLAGKHNQSFHQPMVKGLFPNLQTQTPAFQAKRNYPHLLEALLAPRSEDGVTPALNAGLPPSAEDVTRAMLEVERDFRANNLLSQSTLFDEAQQADLRHKKEERLRRLLQDRAQALNLYAQTDSNAADFPFAKPAWLAWSSFDTLEGANATTSWLALWNAQIALWIQQDIAAVIAVTNRVGEPASNVITAPVKRLISVEVLEGPVGIIGPGALAGSNTGSGPGASWVVGSVGENNRIIVPSPAAALPDNYIVAPTGRASNGLYDVYHTRVALVADAQLLPELFNSLTSVNYMTILNVQVTGVDEYQELNEHHYLYGPGDAVRLDIVLETIWLRSWTAPLMPTVVRDALDAKLPAGM
jgi:hypothetical protein